MAEDAKPTDNADAPPLPPIAAKARDLEALRTAVVDAANVSGALWFSYLFVLLYLVIAVGSVTHRNLFFETPVRLPFLNVDLPMLGFFALGPAIFLVVHAYVLLHFAMLADKVGAFHAELQTQIVDDAIRTRLRRQLPSNIFVQFLAGPREIRSGLMGAMLRLIALISLVIGPIALLVFFQIQFLPYHHEVITWWHRIAVVIDLALLWALWPSVARGETTRLTWRDFKKAGVITAAALSVLPVLLVFTIATFPGEWLGRDPERAPFVQELGRRPLSWATLHDVLFDGDIDIVAGKPTSLWSHRLVLPNLEQPPEKFSLRGRHLEGAVLLSASLKKVDFTAARLQGAVLRDADLSEARFLCADVSLKVEPGAEAWTGSPKQCVQLQGAQLGQANLTGALLSGAQLRRANLDFTRLQNAKLDGAQLQNAFLNNAKLHGTSLNDANLEQANLSAAELQGASLQRAKLNGAFMPSVNLKGAQLEQAELRGAIMNSARLQGATLRQAQLPGVQLENAELQGAVLESATLRAARLAYAKLQGASLVSAFLEGAWLNHAQLHGADLTRARLNGASLDKAGLQGAGFDNVFLDGATIQDAFVWRADVRTAQGLARVASPEPRPRRGFAVFDCQESLTGCEWPAGAFAILKRMIETEVPEGENRGRALRRIAILDPEKPLEEEKEMWAAWADLAKRTPAPADYDATLAEMWRRLGCNPREAPHVLRGLLRSIDDRFAKGNVSAGALATNLLEPSCEGTKGLSEEDMAKLRAMDIRARGAAAASTASGTAKQ
jgi:uncharacterized protein YjbI with pentapeptide repeats